jgi:hypothetical protein
LLLIDIIDNKYLFKQKWLWENFETFMFAFHPQVAIALTGISEIFLAFLNDY